MLSLTIGALWFLRCQPWITSVQPPNSPHPDARLINTEGNSSSNNVLLPVHALRLRGRLAPCIPASQIHTHMLPSVSHGEKIGQHCWSELLSLPARYSGSLTEAVMFVSRDPWVCPWLISKNTSFPAAADMHVSGSPYRLIFTKCM